MLVSICAQLFDYSGNYLVDADTKNTDLSFVSRRVNRTATLDGGCVIVDNGYTAADATFTIWLSNIDNDTRLGLLALAQTHSSISVATTNGIFLGVIERIDDKGNLQIKFLVQAQLNG